MAWAAASTPPSCPTESCRSPTDFIVSSFVNEDTALPIILLNTSPMPIGRIPGFLSSGIKRQFTMGSMHFGSTCSDAKRLTMLAMESQSASLVLPPDLEHRSLFHRHPRDQHYHSWILLLFRWFCRRCCCR